MNENNTISSDECNEKECNEEENNTISPAKKQKRTEIFIDYYNWLTSIKKEKNDKICELALEYMGDKKYVPLIKNEELRCDGHGLYTSKPGSFCPGWDGYSSHCKCGNRRVEWEYNSYHDIVYPKSY